MPMIELSAATEIAAAPADIAAIMFDPSREPEWIAIVKTVEVVDPALQPGARVRRTGSVMGRDLAWTSEVERVHFPHLLALKVTGGPFTGQVAYNIQRSGGGSTVQVQARGEAPDLGMIPAAMITAGAKAAFAADLARLKALVEKT